MELSQHRCMVLLSLVALASCGPVQVTTNISLANKRLYEARLAGADIVVPGAKYITPAQHEYQLALLYMDKSKELEGFSKFEHAAYYSKLAADLGMAAVEHKAEEARRQERRTRIRKGEVLPKASVQPNVRLP